MRAKKSLGQNFLTSKVVAEDIIEAANLSAQDTVLEIGPGKGFLTEELLKKAGEVIVVEKDDRLIEYLQGKFKEEIQRGKLTIIHGDILNLELKDYELKAGNFSIIANIPYYITGQLLRLFLESNIQPKKMVLMVQKEVAERIVTSDKKESILSISIKAYGVPHYIKKVSAKHFSPQPKVDSAILLIDKISKDLFFNDESRDSVIEEEKKFFEIVKTGFAYKRKMLLNNLNKNKNVRGSTLDRVEDIKKAFEYCNISLKTRAEKLTVKQWVCLVKHLQ